MIFTATLFKIPSKHQRQYKCLSAGKWINKLHFTHTTNYFSVIKGKTLIQTTYVNTRIIMLCEKKVRVESLLFDSTYMKFKDR